MVFKVIDNQIVGLTKGIKTFSVSSSGKVTRLVDDFNNLKTTTGLTTNAWDTMIEGVERKYGTNAADYLRNVAQQGDAARASVGDFYAALVHDTTHGFRNVQSVINTFNSLDPATQQQFAQAIGLTNRLPVHVFTFAGQSGLPQNSSVMLEQIRVLDKSRLTYYVGRINDFTMDEGPCFENKRGFE